MLSSASRRYKKWAIFDILRIPIVTRSRTTNLENHSSLLKLSRVLLCFGVLQNLNGKCLFFLMFCVLLSFLFLESHFCYFYVKIPRNCFMLFCVWLLCFPYGNPLKLFTFFVLWKTSFPKGFCLKLYFFNFFTLKFNIFTNKIPEAKHRNFSNGSQLNRKLFIFLFHEKQTSLKCFRLKLCFSFFPVCI